MAEKFVGMEEVMGPEALNRNGRKSKPLKNMITSIFQMNRRLSSKERLQKSVEQDETLFSHLSNSTRDCGTNSSPVLKKNRKASTAGSFKIGRAKSIQTLIFEKFSRDIASDENIEVVKSPSMASPHRLSPVTSMTSTTSKMMRGSSNSFKSLTDSRRKDSDLEAIPPITKADAEKKKVTDMERVGSQKAGKKSGEEERRSFDCKTQPSLSELSKMHEPNREKMKAKAQSLRPKPGLGTLSSNELKLSNIGTAISESNPDLSQSFVAAPSRKTQPMRRSWSMRGMTSQKPVEIGTQIPLWRRAESTKSPQEVQESISSVVDEEMISKIATKLPKRLQNCEFDLLYSTRDHEKDLKQLYKRVGKKQHTLILIEDMQGNKFGGYASSTWQSNLHFYGNSECFLFKVDQNELKVFSHTRANDFHQFSNRDSFAMGGGDTGFGFIIHCSLRKGTSKRSETYDNPPLSDSEEFDISTLEVFSLNQQSPQADYISVKEFDSVFV